MSDPITQSIVTGAVQGVASAVAKHMVSKALGNSEANKREIARNRIITQEHEQLIENVRKAESGNFVVGKGNDPSLADIERRTNLAKQELAEFEKKYINSNS